MAAEDSDKTQTFHIRMASDRPQTMGQRSDRKSERPRLPASSPFFNKSKSDMISYEDLLVAQYIDEIKRQKQAEPKREQQVTISPYLQKLPHRTGKVKRRPMSACVAYRPSSGKPKIDAKFIADESLWDPETPRQRKLYRPASAPVRRLRPPSGRSIRSRPGSGRKNIFQRQPHMIKAFAFKNGSRDKFVHVTAPTMKILLEMVTEKLYLPFAARRVFLEDGFEIFDESHVPINGDIYISMGENYKDPFQTTKRSMIARNKSMWTLTGIVLPDGGREKRMKTRMSKRMKSLCKNNMAKFLVFKNGNGTQPYEVVTEMNNEELKTFFLTCTGKFDFRSHAKLAFDWQMKEIRNLGEAPFLHESIAQQGKTPVFGPLWVSCGEPCRPSGPYEFLTKMLKPRIVSRLNRDKKFKKELQSAIQKDKNNVTITELLSMSADELESSLSKVDEDIYMGEEDLKEVEEKIESLSGPVREQEEKGSKYSMSHIQELSTDDRLVGTHGIKLKIYENGKGFDEMVFFFNLREALKGIAKDKNQSEKLLQRLLDEISNTRFAYGSTNRNLSSVIQKLYDMFGHEIKDVRNLQQEQCVWMSFGEPYMCPFTYCLQLNIDKATKLPATDSENNEDVIVRENLGPDFDEFTKESNKWEASIGFPALYDDSQKSEEEEAEAFDPDKIEYLKSMSRIDYRSHYLLLKELNNLALYPELCFGDKSGSKLQTFLITESGYICSKAFPQLCLGVSDKRLETSLFDKGIPMEGFAVTVQKRMEGNPNQIWRFSVNTTISCNAYPNLLLTYLGNKFGDEETYLNNPPQGGIVGERFYLIVADELPKKEAAAQRFAIKQERFDQIGQWKHTDYTNNEFNKLAYSWPVKSDGSLNEKYSWPMEGSIMPHAPPVHKKQESSWMLPAKMRILKNGERYESEAISIVGPDLSSLLKENARKEQNAKKKKNKGKSFQPVDDEQLDDKQLHCLDFSVREIELLMFLVHCTSVLQLPFAARRLFDAKGTEIFSLASVEQDQLGYVTCGGTWLDPKLTRKEQKRRYELSRLSSDVNKIKQFCALRNPENLVLEINGPVSQGSSVIVNSKWSREEEQQHDRGDTMSSKRSTDPQQSLRLSEDQELQTTEGSKDDTKMTSREIALQRSEDRLNSLKWPWERLVNVNNSMDNEDPEAYKYTDKDMYEKYKPQSSPRISRDTLQKFTFEDGYIALVTNRTLVLSMAEEEGRVVEIELAKRKPDDVNQQWIVRENGEIRPRSNGHLVMTVGMPSIKGDQAVQPVTGCPVNLQARKTNMFGKAHQRWRYDAETGFIHAFFADLPDKEITAANRADVCTYAIAQAADIDQPGYLLEFPSKDGVSEHKVCFSCARGMRGRFKLQRLPPNTNFHCAMGDAKKLKIPQVGSFAVLNNKVDLSTYEADITLQYWSDVLEVLRRQTSVQTISKEINAAKSIRTVKVMAYKNGEGRLRKGEIICGSSVQGILCQCNHRLGMSNAPRRIYLEDGSLALETEDLVNHAIENCKIEMVNMLLLNKEKGFNFDPDNQDLEEEDDASRLKRLQAAANEEISQQLRRSLDLMGGSGDGPQQKEGRGGERGRGGEEEGDEEESSEQQEEDDSEQRDVDNEEAMKIRRERDELLRDIKLPPLDIILRAPIEVWISSGKAFVAPEVVESKEENRRKKRQFRAQVGLALDIDKHVLRQMKGRRLEKMEPGNYRSTLSSKQPVLIEKTWQEPTVEEQDKHHSVHKLQTHLGEIKANQQDDSGAFVGVNLDGKLYQQPNMKRVMVYPNGESMERSVYIWGESLDELLDNATSKLGMWKNARILYTLDGKRVEDFDAIQRDQLLCVSSGKSFLQPTNQKVNIEIKANWGRARKQYGQRATDVVVDVRKNPQVDVDPFGPPKLALPLK